MGGDRKGVGWGDRERKCEKDQGNVKGRKVNVERRVGMEGGMGEKEGDGRRGARKVRWREMNGDGCIYSTGHNTYIHTCNYRCTHAQ